MIKSIISGENATAAADMRTHLLSTGSRLMYLRGFKNTSISDICREADIPKGSFYYYFGSKEAFAMDVIERHYTAIRERQEKYFSSGDGGYIEKLRGFFNESKNRLIDENFSGGCPIGNLAQELSDVNEELRRKLDDTFEKVKKSFRLFIVEARHNNEVSSVLDAEEIADFIFNSWEGALIRMKVKKDISPLLLFEKFIFERLLAPSP